MICDINLPAAKKILRADFYGTLKECDAVSGWLPPKSIEDIRNAIKESVMKTSEQLELDPSEAATVFGDSDVEGDLDDESYAW